MNISQFIAFVAFYTRNVLFDSQCLSRDCFNFTIYNIEPSEEKISKNSLYPKKIIASKISYLHSNVTETLIQLRKHRSISFNGNQQQHVLYRIVSRNKSVLLRNAKNPDFAIRDLGFRIFRF